MCTHKALLCYAYNIMFFWCLLALLKREVNNCAAWVKSMVWNCSEFKIFIKDAPKKNIHTHILFSHKELHMCIFVKKRIPQLLFWCGTMKFTFHGLEYAIMSFQFSKYAVLRWYFRCQLKCFSKYYHIYRISDFFYKFLILIILLYTDSVSFILMYLVSRLPIITLLKK